jgi:predicted glycosyltransferase
MKYLFHLGHPAHFHLFKYTIFHLKSKGHKVDVLIKKKDVLESLLINSNLDYINILPDGRKDSKLGIAIGQLKQDFKVLIHCISNRPDLLIGTSVAISHVGKILGIPSINVNEDDAEVVPLYAKLAYPWASCILAPFSCSVGKWTDKKISYFSYHELAYLHPNRFSPNPEVVKKYLGNDFNYFVIRFASLKAHHDEGVKGIDFRLAEKIIKILQPHGRVLITSEVFLPSNLEPYRMNINPLDMHDMLAFSKMYIGDSQTMAAEAGVLGVPFIRFNDFVGKISYLRDLEEVYKLGFGIPSNKPDLLLKKIHELLELSNCNEIFLERKNQLINDKLDATSFFIWFIENFPRSQKIMKENPNHQYRLADVF